MIVGARIRWKNGDILHPSNMWKSPSKRRLPRLLIEQRAREVGIVVYINESWIVFHETTQSSNDIDISDAVSLEFYAKRFYLLPQKTKRQDTYEWMQKPDNALLIWANDNTYFSKPVHLKQFLI